MLPLGAPRSLATAGNTCELPQSPRLYCYGVNLGLQSSRNPVLYSPLWPALPTVPSRDVSCCTVKSNQEVCLSETAS